MFEGLWVLCFLCGFGLCDFWLDLHKIQFLSYLSQILVILKRARNISMQICHIEVSQKAKYIQMTLRICVFNFLDT